MNRLPRILLASAVLATGADAAAQPAADPAPGVMAVLDEELTLLRETLENNHELILALQAQVKELQAKSAEQQKALEALKALRTNSEGLAARLQAIEKERTHEATARRVELQNRSVLAGMLAFDAAVRVRGETINNRFDLDDDTDDATTFAQHRVRLGVRFKPLPTAELYVQAQDVRVWGSEPDTLADDEGLGLHQGYARFDDVIARGLWVQAGRFEMEYGSGRLIGSSDFDSAGRAFDGARIGYHENGVIQLDGFVAKVTERGYQYGSDRELWGVWASTTALRGFTFDLYTLLSTGDHDSGEERVGTVGARVAADLDFGLFGEAEAAVQFGERGGNDVLAAAYAVELGYRLKEGPVPFDLSMFLNTASGDANPNDGNDVDFDPLYPSRHEHWGRLNIATWRNLTSFGPRFKITALEVLHLEGELHSLWLVTPFGTRFGLGDARATADELTHMGEELDLRLAYTPWEWATVELGYSFFIPDTEEGLLRGEDRVDWGYLQVDARF